MHSAVPGASNAGHSCASTAAESTTGRRVGRFAKRIAITLLMALVAARTMAAQSSLEYQVKAAFLFNFVTFTEWPAAALQNPTDPLRICVFKNDEFARQLEATVRGEVIAGHPLVVEPIDAPPDVARCQVLFIPRKEAARATELIESARDAPVLTVGESDLFLQDGGMVNFVIEDGHVRFDINQQLARERALSLSSKLLQIARSVR